LFEAPIHHSLWVLLFVLAGSMLLGALGIIAGIWSEKFDQLAAFQNFIILPLTFLSGVFYSIHSLPSVWQHLSHLNPFFYIVDGIRYGFLGISDISPYFSLAVVISCLAVVAWLTLWMLKTGYKIRH
jgi:ABC-2 type transport system permease protein